MSMLVCADVRTLAPELALATVGGAERAEVLAHTETCAACRTLVAELSETADALALLVPEVEPPAGFADRAAAALGVERARARRRPWRRGLAVAAAAAALIAATAVVSVTVVRLTGHDAPVPAAARPGTVDGDVHAATMVGASGHVAGRAFAYEGEHPWVFVTVDYSNLPAGAYGVELATADGRRSRVGSVSVDDHGQGQWGGSAPGAGALGAVRLLRPDGAVLCEARFGASVSPAG